MDPESVVPSSLHLPPASQFAQKRDLGHPLNSAIDKPQKVPFDMLSRSN
jgi:hypothetical protein